jgi:hypothetical protein
MNYNKPVMNCVCGNKPKLLKKEILGKGSVKYFNYACDKCNTNTFGTREEMFCRELWNATIERKLKK